MGPKTEAIITVGLLMTLTFSPIVAADNGPLGLGNVCDPSELLELLSNPEGFNDLISDILEMMGSPTPDLPAIFDTMIGCEEVLYPPLECIESIILGSVTDNESELACGEEINESVECSLAIADAIFSQSTEPACGSQECVNPESIPYCETMIELGDMLIDAIPFDGTGIGPQEKQTVNQAAKDANDHKPRPDSTYCEDRETTGNGGLWSISLPTESISASAGDDFDSTEETYAAFGSFSLDLPDSGTTTQRICFIPDTWSAVSPTQMPDNSDRQHHQNMCKNGKKAYWGGLTLVVAGTVVLATGVGAPAGWAMWGAGAGMATAGALTMEEHCPQANADADVGYMRCVGQAKVT